MILKHKTEKDFEQIFKLPHNSLFILGWKTNRQWLHSIKRDYRLDIEKDPDELALSSQRISLTLRTIATFRNCRTGQLYGQGASCKTIDQLSNKQDESTSSDDEQYMLHAFNIDNEQSSEFDWNHYYGKSFDVVHFKILKSHCINKEDK